MYFEEDCELLKEGLKLVEVFKRLVKEEEGQGLVEYALIIVLVSVGLIVALGTLKDNIAAAFGRITNALTK